MLWVSLVTLAWVNIATAGSDHRLGGMLLCSACQALVKEITVKMREQENSTQTVALSHRLDKDNKVRRKEYRKTELRAQELLDGICDTMNSYQLKEEPSTHFRLFSKNSSLPGVTYYDDDDKEELRTWKKNLEWSCNVFVNDLEDELVAAIRSEQGYDQFSEGLCNTTAKVCAFEELAPGMKKEMTKRKKWQKAERKRKKKEEKKRKAEEAKKAVEEAARLAREEEERLAANGTDANGTETNETSDNTPVADAVTDNGTPGAGDTPPSSGVAPGGGGGEGGEVGGESSGGDASSSSSSSSPGEGAPARAEGEL